MRLHISFCAFYCSLSSILFSYFHHFMLLLDRKWKYERETEYIMTLLSRPSSKEDEKRSERWAYFFFFDRIEKNVENFIQADFLSKWVKFCLLTGIVVNEWIWKYEFSLRSILRDGLTYPASEWDINCPGLIGWP